MKIKETTIKTSEILAEMRKKFDVYCYYSDEQLDKDFPVPKEITEREFKDNIEADEADEEYKSMSAKELDGKGIVGITLRERLLMEIQYFDKTGYHLDIESITLCSGSRDSGGDVPSVYWSPAYRMVYVDWCHVLHSSPPIRTRAVVSNTL
jgi:hypothetical protein